MTQLTRLVRNEKSRQIPSLSLAGDIPVPRSTYPLILKLTQRVNSFESYTGARFYSLRSRVDSSVSINSFN